MVVVVVEVVLVDDVDDVVLDDAVLDGELSFVASLAVRAFGVGAGRRSVGRHGAGAPS